MSSLSSDWFSTVLIFVVGIFSLVWGWWLWWRPESVKQGSWLYRWYQLDYKSMAWLFRRRKVFDRDAAKYIRHQGKAAVVIGVLIIAVGLAGLWSLFT